MHKKLYASVSVTALTVGLVGVSASAALADPETSGSGGAASGNQINVPADVEADLCGNSLAALGISEAECTEVAEVLYAASDDGNGSPQTDGSGGVASGNQINIPVDAAVDICGNSVAVGGISEADCTTIVEELNDSSEGGDGAQTDGSGGVASGNQINIPVDAAVDICGNSIAGLGVSKAECTTVVEEIQDSEDNDGGAQTDGSDGVASGNQVNVPVDAAVDICGNSVAVVGVSEASCMEKISSDESDSEDPSGEEPEDPKKPGEENPDDKGEGDDKNDKNKDENKDDSAADDGTNDDQAAAGGNDKDTAGGLPVTGTALAGLVSAALAALGAGGAAMYFSRKRKAALATEENVAA
ncbi:intracellular sulfur oxidation DsrE/DsrF family protein [Lipingzhangella halophila]|uniref:Intracellular sulfur oxidation DsrE/DsrF family protein n=1 Tax=Lipingzhangella halophila TaxID=1783352 RepID=A0A7W7RMD3_9ACTN|nr:chaplin family protein [Lipingzhangella halophila]MBB4934668.1 intracellular sulfur oxidation DsrE/DsrF family protein [Lipingzhangella halophila]